MSKLIVTIDGVKADEVHIDHGNMNIGRNKENDIRLNDVTVSGRHAKIITFFEPTLIEDLNSTNGIYVNNNRVQKQTLRDGDVITIGKYQLVFEYDNDDAIVPIDERTQMLKPEEIEKLLKNASAERIREIADKDLIPEEVRWVAQDQEGMWWGFSNKPIEETQGWIVAGNGSAHQLLQSSPDPDWKKTIRKL